MVNDKYELGDVVTSTPRYVANFPLSMLGLGVGGKLIKGRSKITKFPLFSNTTYGIDVETGNRLKVDPVIISTSIRQDYADIPINGYWSIRQALILNELVVMNDDFLQAGHPTLLKIKQCTSLIARDQFSTVSGYSGSDVTGSNSVNSPLSQDTKDIVHNLYAGFWEILWSQTVLAVSMSTGRVANISPSVNVPVVSGGAFSVSGAIIGFILKGELVNYPNVLNGIFPTISGIGNPLVNRGGSYIDDGSPFFGPISSVVSVNVVGSLTLFPNIPWWPA